MTLTKITMSIEMATPLRRKVNQIQRLVSRSRQNSNGPNIFTIALIVDVTRLQLAESH